MAGLRKEIDRYIEEVVPTVPEYEVMYDVKGQPETLKRLGHMSKYDEYFSDLIHTGKFTSLAELLLDGEVVPQYSQLFNKPARVGVETPAHQDSFYIPLTPNEALTMWLALDTVDRGERLPAICIGRSQASNPSARADRDIRILARGNRLRRGRLRRGGTGPGGAWRRGHPPLVDGPPGRADTSDRDRWGLGTIYHSANAKPDSELQEARTRDLEKKRVEWAAKGQSGR